MDDLVRAEYPRIDFSRNPRYQKDYSRIQTNLFSDKFFVPIFGKPFDQFGKKRKINIYKAFTGCQKKANYKTEMEQGRALIKPFFLNDERTKDFENEIDKVNKLRHELEKTLEILQSSNKLDDSTINSIMVKANGEYHRLLPSEVRKLENLIKSRFPDYDRFQRSHLTSKKLDAKNALRPGSQPISFSNSYAYFDWASNFPTGQFIFDENRAVQKLKSTIDKMYSIGRWKCLSQTKILVRSDSPSHFTLKSGTPRSLSLIFAPTGSHKLIYKVSGYGKINGRDYDYPIFYSTSPTNSSFRVTLFVKPNEYSSNYNIDSLPVTIYTFGNSLGDYGSGCSYYAEGQIRSQFLQQTLISQIIFAFLFEKGRKASFNDGNTFVETLLENGRDRSLEMLYSAFFPTKKNREIQLYTILTGLIMEGNFDLNNFSKSMFKNWLSEQSKEIDPQVRLDSQTTDFFVDLFVNKTWDFGGKSIKK